MAFNVKEQGKGLYSILTDDGEVIYKDWTKEQVIDFYVAHARETAECALKYKHDDNVLEFKYIKK